MKGNQKIYTILLDPKERQALEKIRERTGTRNASDTLRLLIIREAEK